MNEVFEAINNRIKTPYFGYSILAFIGLNWRGFFYLIFTKGTPDERLDTFDMHTSFLSLIIFPLLIGAFIAITFHWLKYYFSLIELKPRRLYENLQLESENENIIKKTELERLRAESIQLQEQELIDRAKRDITIENIEDSSIKNKLKQQIDVVRTKKSGEFINTKRTSDMVLKDANNRILALEKNYYEIKENENDYKTKEDRLAIYNYIRSECHALKNVKDITFRKRLNLLTNSLDKEVNRLVLKIE